MTSTVHAEVDTDVVERATQALQQQGMDLAEAVQVVLHRVARDGGLLLEPQESAAYDAWFCAKVQEAIDDPRPALSEQEVEARAAARRKRLLERL